MRNLFGIRRETYMSFDSIFWMKFIVTFPIRILLMVPFWIIFYFSKEKANKYFEKNVLLHKIDEWIFK